MTKARSASWSFGLTCLGTSADTSLPSPGASLSSRVLSRMNWTTPGSVLGGGRHRRPQPQSTCLNSHRRGGMRTSGSTSSGVRATGRQRTHRRSWPSGSMATARGSRRTGRSRPRWSSPRPVESTSTGGLRARLRRRRPRGSTSGSATAWAAIKVSGAWARSSGHPEHSTTNASALLWWPGASVRSVGTPRAWDPEVIDQAIPELPKAVPNPDGQDETPPLALDAGGRRVWRGEEPKLKDDGRIDRSGSLLKIGRVLYDAGGERPLIVRALRERDEALGWRKYTGRHDADQRYHEIVDELESNGRNARIRVGHRPSEPERDVLPKMVVNSRQLPDVTAEAIEALEAHNDPPEIFVRAGRLVRVREDENGIPEIQAMEDSHIKGRLARVANFVRNTEKGETRVNPPDWTVKDVQALDQWPFPALEAVVEVPIVRPDGTIIDTPGYDPQTRLYYRPVEGFEVPPIAGTPTPSDTQAAIRLLDEAVGEFPYEDRASAANTLALMLTPLVRPAISGPVPLALIDKPKAGTGGSLLAETA